MTRPSPPVPDDGLVPVARRLAEEFVSLYTPGRCSFTDTIEEAFQWLQDRSIGSIDTSAALAASDRDVLREALEEAREALALSAAVPPVDYQNRDAVVNLGERIGYGALMAIASVEWRARLGDLVGGEFCAGPCRSTAESAIAKIDAALVSLGGEGGGEGQTP